MFRCQVKIQVLKQDKKAFISKCGICIESLGIPKSEIRVSFEYVVAFLPLRHISPLKATFTFQVRLHLFNVQACFEYT